MPLVAVDKDEALIILLAVMDALSPTASEPDMSSVPASAVAPEAFPIFRVVAAPAKLMVVVVVFNNATVVWLDVIAPVFNAMAVVKLAVRVELVPAPMVNAVAAPPKLIVVLVVLSNATVV